MRKWLAFIFVPEIAKLVLVLISATFGSFYSVDVGGFLEVGNFYDCLIHFVISFTCGVIIYNLAPNKNKLFSSLLYVLFISGSSIYGNYTASGTVEEIFGNTLVLEFYPMLEISQIVGYLLAIFKLNKSEKQKAIINTKTVSC